MLDDTYTNRVVITGFEALNPNGLLQHICDNLRMENYYPYRQENPRVYEKFYQEPRNLVKTMDMATYSMYLVVKNLLQNTKILNPQDTALICASTFPNYNDTATVISKKIQNFNKEVTVPEIFRLFNNSMSFNIAKALGFNSQITSPSAACATSLQAMILGYQAIKSGSTLRAVCGGSDDNTEFLNFVFKKLGLLSKECKPFAEDRVGILPINCASAVMLEEYHHAKDRGATIYGEIIGIGMSMSDSLTASSTSSITKCMVQAIWDAQNNLEDEIPVDVLDTHATGTQIGDMFEAEAITTLWKNFNKSKIIAWKYLLNHNMAGSGLLELALTLLCPVYDIRTYYDTILPPREIKQEQKKGNIQYILKNSFGLGGINNSVLIQTTKRG